MVVVQYCTVSCYFLFWWVLVRMLYSMMMTNHKSVSYRILYVNDGRPGLILYVW